MGPITHLGKTETLRRETERLQSHLGETEILSVRPICLGFVAVAMTSELDGAGMERISGAEFRLFGLGHMWMWESS